MFTHVSLHAHMTRMTCMRCIHTSDSCVLAVAAGIAACMGDHDCAMAVHRSHKAVGRAAVHVDRSGGLRSITQRARACAHAVPNHNLWTWVCWCVCVCVCVCACVCAVCARRVCTPGKLSRVHWCASSAVAARS